MSIGGTAAVEGKTQIPEPRIEWPAKHVPSSAMVFAQNIVDIAATPEAVFSQLVDCLTWPSWYKHCSEVSILRGGSRLSSGSKFRFKTLGLYFEPEVVLCEPHRMLVWSANGPAGTSGSHAWYIETRAEGCRITTEESQSGWLLFFLRARTRSRLLTSHEEWLHSLKQRVEAIGN